MDGVAARRAVRRRAASSAWWWTWPSRATCRPSKLVEPLDGARGPRAAPSSCGSGCGWPRSTARRRRAGCALVLPPGHGHGRRGAAHAGEARAVGRDHRSGTGGARRRARARVPASRPFCGSSRDATCVRPRRWRPLDPARPRGRGLLTLCRRGGAAAAGDRARGRRAGRGPAAHPAQQARSPRVADAARRPAGDRRLLLHGATGSGKTEVYLRAVAAALERGRTRDRAGARDRAHAADGGALPRALRRRRGDPALQALRGRAPRRVAAAAPRRGARVRRGRARRCSRRCATSA